MHTRSQPNVKSEPQILMGVFYKRKKGTHLSKNHKEFMIDSLLPYPYILATQNLLHTCTDPDLNIHLR